MREIRACGVLARSLARTGRSQFRAPSEGKDLARAQQVRPAPRGRADRQPRRARRLVQGEQDEAAHRLGAAGGRGEADRPQRSPRAPPRGPCRPRPRSGPSRRSRPAAHARPPRREPRPGDGRLHQRVLAQGRLHPPGHVARCRRRRRRPRRSPRRRAPRPSAPARRRSRRRRRPRAQGRRGPAQAGPAGRAGRASTASGPAVSRPPPARPLSPGRGTGPAARATARASAPARAGRAAHRGRPRPAPGGGGETLGTCGAAQSSAASSAACAARLRPAPASRRGAPGDASCRRHRRCGPSQPQHAALLPATLPRLHVRIMAPYAAFAIPRARLRRPEDSELRSA